jgi:hypothetical protein
MPGVESIAHGLALSHRTVPGEMCGRHTAYGSSVIFCNNSPCCSFAIHFATHLQFSVQFPPKTGAVKSPILLRDVVPI